MPRAGSLSTFVRATWTCTISSLTTKTEASPSTPKPAIPKTSSIKVSIGAFHLKITIRHGRRVPMRDIRKYFGVLFITLTITTVLAMKFSAQADEFTKEDVARFTKEV